MKGKSSLWSLAGGVGPLPNRVVDEVMPTLKDTELRVLLVVLRQTWGWRDGSGRFKARDWLTASQLRARTGRASESVSGAVDSLVRRGLIVVEDAAGRTLPTASHRRRHLGRLYYRLGPGMRFPEAGGGGAAVDMWKTSDACRPGKPKTTTETQNNKRGQESLRVGGWRRAGTFGAIAEDRAPHPF